MEKDWKEMNDEEIMELQERDWPEDKNDSALLKSIVKHMRDLSPDEYRNVLKNRDRRDAAIAS